MEQAADALNDSAEWPARKRLRTSHAVSIFLSVLRCTELTDDSVMPVVPARQGVMETTLVRHVQRSAKTAPLGLKRIRKRLFPKLSAYCDRNVCRQEKQKRSDIGKRPQTHNSPQTHRTNSFSGSSPDLNLRRQSQAIQTPTSQDHRENVNNFENAVLDSMHTSTTESVLQWPHFDIFPLLRHDGESIFHLEQSRTPLPVAANPMYPYVDAEDIVAILEAFERNVNFWYPSMSQAQLVDIRATLQNGMPAEDTVHSCLCLLTLALGCASQAAEDLRFLSEPDIAEKDKRVRKRKLGDIYFQLALKKLHVAHLQVDSESTQCLFFTADYMAELSACPPSGIARVESSVPLPSTYHTHTSEIVEEESSLYFLACISMRRLLNRVHQLLYARDTGAAFDHTRFPRIVAELQRQLDDWRDVLPASFSFSVDTEEAATAAGGFLRQRYLTCKGVIYRPYLMWMLSSSHTEAGVSARISTDCSGGHMDMLALQPKCLL
ncbi:hypothetical protein NW762_005601 [Fusarium torreyae]|uniref:Uncharacterized protein n=1 Tax=Fusarium torreyae TaxID=1237075 RepID=A0A9W8S1Z0_9HYPO|nr:hypothetical protein NW762_005601 [Fusarium torreyae]